MREKGLQNLALTGYIKGKRTGEVVSLYEWMVEQAVGALAKVEKLKRVTRQRKLCSAMIAHAFKGHVT